MEGRLLGGGGVEVSIMPVVYPCGMVSFSSLGVVTRVTAYTCNLP